MLGAVTHQTAGRDGLAHGIDRGDPISGRQRDNPFPMGVHERAGADVQRASPELDERCKGGLNFAVAANFENDELLPDRLRGGLHVSSLRLGIRTVRVHEHRQLSSLWARAGAAAPVALPPTRVEKAHARDIAARPVEAGDEAVPDRVAPGRKDDRHRRGCGLGRERRRGIADDHSHRPANQIATSAGSRSS